MKKLLFIILFLPSFIYAHDESCPTPKITKHFIMKSDEKVYCSGESDCVNKWCPDPQTTTTSLYTETKSYQCSVETPGHANNQPTSILMITKTDITYTNVDVTNSGESESSPSLMVNQECIGENQCEGNDSKPPFSFSSTDDIGADQPPPSICVTGCRSNLTSGVSVVVGENGSGGFVGEYQPTDQGCAGESSGTSTPTDPQKLTFEVDGEPVDKIKDKELCTEGGEHCIPLFEAGTGNVTDEEGRDMKVDEQGENCGTVNGEFGCIPNGGTNLATITDENGKKWDLNNPKNPINNPTINKTAGDSDSDYAITRNTVNNTTVTNATNNTGGSGGTNTGGNNGGGDGDGTGSVDSAGIIAANKATTDSVNALKNSNTAHFNNVKGALNTLKATNEAKLGQVKTSVDGVKGSVDGVKSAVETTGASTNGKLDALNQSVKDNKIDLGPTVGAINRVNDSVQEVLAEVKKVTSTEGYEDNPEVTGQEETFDTFYTKLQTVPIVQAYENISVSFSTASCFTPSLSFEILGNNVNGDLSMACEVIDDIKHVLGIIMLFVYGFFGARIVISA